MTGLEKILKHIEEDANVASGKVIKEANKMATKIIMDAKAESEKIRIASEEKLKHDIEAMLSRSRSAAILQEKKIILDAKQEIISDVIDRAKESIISLSDKEYFEVIIKMIQKYCLSQQGDILFSEKDKKRMPENFQTTIDAALKGIQDASLSVSKETRNINGGFILIYGDIEENCSFDALFFAARESLQDRVCKMLFD
jgi:V/A-type H+/Na+-transporting ATPase subunit E